MTKSSIKAQYLPGLAAVAVADGLILFMALNGWEIPDAPNTRLLASRAAVSLIAAAAVLLLAGILPVAAKDRLVFWRWREALPGHRAFSDDTLSDPRIDAAKLARNIQISFPTVAREQNTAWYRLFKKVETDPSVDQCNRAFLLLRELGALSFVATAGCAVWWLVSPKFQDAAEAAIALFAVQYVLAAVSSKNYGHRLVTTVLAAHSVKRRA